MKSLWADHATSCFAPRSTLETQLAWSAISKLFNQPGLPYGGRRTAIWRRRFRLNGANAYFAIGACVFAATGFTLLATELILGLNSNKQPRIVWATPGLWRCPFYFQRILGPVARWAYYPAALS